MDKVEVLKIVIFGETEITVTKEAVSISAPKIILESGKLNHQS
jgi:hypothetical protein